MSYFKSINSLELFFFICFIQTSFSNNIIANYQPDTFNYRTSENIAKDYINFLKNQNIDTILIFYTSEGKLMKYINITNYVYFHKGQVFISYQTTYPIDSKQKGQIYFAQNKKLNYLHENKIKKILFRDMNFSEKLNDENKPFENMWKKRKWRKLYLFGIEANNQDNIYNYQAVGILNRSFANTKSSNHSLLFKQKRLAKKLYKLLKNYTTTDIKKILK